MAQKKKKNKGFGVACCFLVALVIFIVFLVQRKTIAENLKNSNLFERMGVKTPKVIEEFESKKDSSADGEINLTEENLTIKVETESESAQSTSSKATNSKSTENTEKNITTEQNLAKTEEKSVNPQKNDSETGSKTSAEKKSNSTATAETQFMELQLCFVDYGADGIVYRQIVKRKVPKNDAPLSTAINLLLAGPDITSNSEKNCQTLIPENTKLNKAEVKNGIAYLDFSEEFEFNRVGVEGYTSQLMQVVYTATSFSTVKSVQFLIEGQKKVYLGSEGQRIDAPLSRNSF